MGPSGPPWEARDCARADRRVAADLHVSIPQSAGIDPLMNRDMRPGFKLKVSLLGISA
jgi:hypothetical protein